MWGTSLTHLNFYVVTCVSMSWGERVTLPHILTPTMSLGFHRSRNIRPGRGGGGEEGGGKKGEGRTSEILKHYFPSVLQPQRREGGGGVWHLRNLPENVSLFKLLMMTGDMAFYDISQEEFCGNGFYDPVSRC